MAESQQTWGFGGTAGRKGQAEKRKQFCRMMIVHLSPHRLGSPLISYGTWDKE